MREMARLLMDLVGTEQKHATITVGAFGALEAQLLGTTTTSKAPQTQSLNTAAKPMDTEPINTKAIDT
jgi:hypothetical protein